METNSQLIKKIKEGGYNNVYPIAYIDGIIDKESNEKLSDILIRYNNIMIPWQGDVASTRNRVPSLMRRQGIVITYITDLSEIVTEVYKGTVEDIKNNWVDNINWELVPDLKFVQDNASKLPDGTITPEKLSPALQELISQSGSVVNMPDDEDLEQKDMVLKFKDRPYNPELASSNGYKILRKNWTNVGAKTINLLTQDVFNQSNTIYEIRYDYNLNNQTITIPEGCILDMRGGSVTNGTINCVDTIIISTDASKLDVTLTGTYRFDSEKLVTSNTEDINISQSVDRKSHTISAMLADRDTTNGMGYVILRKDKSFASQLTQQNTIYVIRYDFTLTGNVTIPENCILEFNGGSINGAHTITGNNTGINAGLVKIFGTDVTLDGNWNINTYLSSWVDNSSDSIIKAIKNCCDIGIGFKFVRGTYNFTNKIILYNNIILEGEQGSIINFNVNEQTLVPAIQCGITGKPWTGSIKGLNIYILSGKYEYIIVMLNSYNCSIEDCLIDVQSHDIRLDNKIISVVNNAKFSYTDHKKENIIISRNTIIADDAEHYHYYNTDIETFCKPESISVSDDVYNITIENNIIYRSIDDFASHMAKNVIIRNNKLFDCMGSRIYCSDSENVLIDGNYIESHGSMGIYVTLECNFRLPKDVVIINNTVKTDTYGIRINAGSDFVIKNNNVEGQIQLYNDYIIENDTHVINPTIDEVTPANVIIEGNILNNNVISIVNTQDKNYIVKSNICSTIINNNTFSIINDNILNNPSIMSGGYNIASGFVEVEIDLSMLSVGQWYTIKNKFGNNIFDLRVGKYIAYLYSSKVLNSTGDVAGKFVTPEGQEFSIDVMNADGPLHYNQGLYEGFVVTNNLPELKVLPMTANTGTLVLRLYYIKQ